jgi:serine/threonine-protein kinase
MILIGNRYLIEQEIGGGRMGMVYRGTDTATQTLVAIKHLRSEVILELPNMVERFAREAAAMQQLYHPNIIRVFATITENDAHYLIMEYASGGTLAAALQQASPLPSQRIVSLALDIADALARAHRFGIIHRDVKPANILLSADGNAQLGDFGEVYLGSRTRITMTDEFMGTLHYMAPEVFANQPPTAGIDLWAYGITLYEMVMGKRPFGGKNARDLMNRILVQPPPPIDRTDIPLELIQLIDQLLQKDPKQRLASAREAGVILMRLLKQG